MGAAGLQPAGDPRRRWALLRPEVALHLVFGDRLAAARPQHRHLLAIARRTPDAGLDHAAGGIRRAPGQGDVDPFDVVPCEQVRQPRVGGVGLGRDHDAGRVLVQAVHDPRPGDAADARQLVPAVVQQGVDQGSVTRPRRRMHRHARGLVQDDQMLVFV